VELTAAESPSLVPRSGARDSSTPVTSLDALLERNEIRTQLILNNPFFLLWREGKFDDECMRCTMLECLTVMTDTFGTLRAGQHELGHHSLAARDPVLRATSTWYRHQMSTLDDSGKAVVNLVLETVGYYLGLLASPILAEDDAANRYERAPEADGTYQKGCARLLADEHPSAYERLHGLLEDTWDILDESTTRIAALVSQVSW